MLSAGGERKRETEKGSRAHRVMDDYEHEYVDGIQGANGPQCQQHALVLQALSCRATLITSPQPRADIQGDMQDV